jgi:hypothetical protein
LFNLTDSEKGDPKIADIETTEEMTAEQLSAMCSSDVYGELFQQSA